MMVLHPNKLIISLKYWKLKMHLILLCGVSVVDSHDLMADEELWLTEVAQYHERILYNASPGKDQNSKYVFY